MNPNRRTGVSSTPFSNAVDCLEACDRASFFAAVDARLDEDALESRRQTFDLPTPAEQAVLAELEREALDLAGRGFVLWARLQRLQRAASYAQRQPSHPQT